MGVLDILATPFKAIGSAYQDSLYGQGWQQRAQQEADDRQRQIEQQDTMFKLKRAQEEMAQKEAQQDLLSKVASAAAASATKSTAPEAATTPLPSGQAGPVLPKFDLPPNALSALPQDQRQQALQMAENTKSDADAAEELKQQQQDRLDTLAGVTKSKAEESARHNQVSEAQKERAMQMASTRPKVFAPHWVTDENGRTFPVDPVEALHSGASYLKQLPAAMLDEKAQAIASREWGANLIKKIPQLADKLGPYQGRKDALQLMVGDPDPEVAGFARDLASLSALQPKLHGMRGVRAMEDFQKGISLNFTPQALAAGIRSYMDLANTVSNSKELAAHPTPSTGKRTRTAKTASGVEYQVED